MTARQGPFRAIVRRPGSRGPSGSARLIGDRAALDFPMRDGEDLQTRDSRLCRDRPPGARLSAFASGA